MIGADAVTCLTGGHALWIEGYYGSTGIVYCLVQQFGRSVNRHEQVFRLTSGRFEIILRAGGAFSIVVKCGNDVDVRPASFGSVNYAGLARLEHMIRSTVTTGA